MKQLLILLAATLLLNSCAGAGKCSMWSTRPDLSSGSACAEDRDYHPIAKTPAEARAYLESKVDKKTLKRWDKAISDDVGVINFDSATGTGTVR